jgi:adenylate cyclase
VIVAIAAIAASLAVSPPLGVLRGLSLDVETALRWRFIGNSHDGAASPTVVVALDEETYRTAPFQGTPSVMWTREIGRVVAATLDAGASVVGFDVVFPSSIEESRISFDGETIAARLRGFDRDYLRALAAAAKSGKIVLGEIQHGDEMIQPTAGQRVAVGQQRNIRSLNVVSDPDDVVRRAPLTLASTSGPTPSMALELAARALGVAPVIGPDRGVGIAGVDFPADADGAMILNFDGGADDIPTYSFADLSACLDKGDEDFFRRNFAGKIVLLGSRLDLGDLKLTSKRFATAPPTRPWERCATPPGAGAPIARSLIDGVFVHATAINNIVRHEAVRDLAAGPRWLIAWAGAAMAATAAFALTPAAAAGAVLVLALMPSPCRCFNRCSPRSSRSSRRPATGFS